MFLSFLTEGLNWNYLEWYGLIAQSLVFILPNRGTELKQSDLLRNTEKINQVFILPNRGTELKHRLEKLEEDSERRFLSFLTEGLNWNYQRGNLPDRSMFLSFLTEGLNWN